ncbi:hypothetical protein ACFJIX_23950 [Roseateles sp. UC29_93]|uniref:hypothetical protein n=1 Tax=Roseateles sp. UC29_93 TaxID=3350177 RepID=UPI00367330B7
MQQIHPHDAVAGRLAALMAQVSASVDLPTPGAPTTVTRRCRTSRLNSACRSAPRPCIATGADGKARGRTMGDGGSTGRSVDSWDVSSSCRNGHANR